MQVLTIVRQTLRAPRAMIWDKNKIIGDSMSGNYRVYHHCMIIIKRVTWPSPSHALLFKLVDSNPSFHFSPAFGPSAALRSLLVHFTARTVS